MGAISWTDLGAYFLLYSFLGWVGESVYYAVTRRGFYNRGFLTLPFLLSYGVASCLLVLTLPSLTGNYIVQFLVTLVVTGVVESLTAHFLRRMNPGLRWGEERSRLFSGDVKGVLQSITLAGGYYLFYLVCHPLALALVSVTPLLIKQVTVLAVLGMMSLDAAAVFIAMRKGDLAGYQRRQAEGGRGKLGHRLADMVWKRLQRAYPGIWEATGEERGEYTFAKGLCLDKLIWVFLVAALMGDVLETLYCGLLAGAWDNRSSVLYGPFSFVWGIGAVVLTVALRPLAQKHDRYVFLSGFVIGGAYEYMCSLFTELVFGTVFWDYSHMPLNIGGRTNALFCFFWGVMALVWVKLIYPKLSGAIERIPALAGKIVTWAVVLVMLCNTALTCAAMVRYDTRAVRPESANPFEAFLDRQYDDAYMERHWQNMKPAP